MTADVQKRISKFLSLVLRHRPELAKLELDPAGWVRVDDLIRGAGAAGQDLTQDALERVVAESDKQRFTLSADGQWIRAAQGHSVPVDLNLIPKTPPATLFHGTAEKSVPSILGRGLVPGARHQVHLSQDVETATRVGQRHGSPVVFAIETQAMLAADHLFYVADNGVWLTDHVPAGFLSRVENK